MIRYIYICMYVCMYMSVYKVSTTMSDWSRGLRFSKHYLLDNHCHHWKRSRRLVACSKLTASKPEQLYQSSSRSSWLSTNRFQT